jgi:ribosomal protein S18 acetylase RimI-like enzyme
MSTSVNALESTEKDVGVTDNPHQSSNNNNNNNKNSALVRGKLRRTRSLSHATLPVFDILGKHETVEPAISSSSSSSSISSINEMVEDTTSSRTKKKPRTRRNHLSASVVTIRPMQLQDIATVFQAGNSIFTASEFPNMYRTWDDFCVVENFESNPEFCFVAEGNQKVVGFLLGCSMIKKSNAIHNSVRGYIQWVAVQTKFRRQGIATRLIAEFQNVARTQNITLLLADTPADNTPALQMFEKAGLTYTSDHVYLTKQIHMNHDENDDPETKQVELKDDAFSFSYKTYMHKNQQQPIRVTIRNMEINDLYAVAKIGECIFTQKSPNLYHFWDEDVVLQSYLSDPEYSIVATVKHNGTSSSSSSSSQETVVAFALGTTIEKPRSSWKYGYIVWLGCDPNYQGIGLASRLYQTLVELFVMSKCRILMVDTQANNEGALAFFRKNGFGHDVPHLYLSNNPPYENHNNDKVDENVTSPQKSDLENKE